MNNIKEHTKAIWKLSNEGMPPREIAKLLGLSRGVVTHAVKRGRKSGHCNPKMRTKVTLQNRSPMRVGSMSQIIDVLSFEQLDRLLTESEHVGYSTCAEYVAELVLDAFSERKPMEPNQ